MGDDQLERQLCAGDCGFFAISIENKYCSQCSKTKFEAEPPAQVEEKKIKNNELCDKCNKPSPLPLNKCLCGGSYCMKHRYSDEHGCEFDRFAECRAELSKKLSSVKKVRQIDRV